MRCTVGLPKLSTEPSHTAVIWEGSVGKFGTSQLPALKPEIHVLTQALISPRLTKLFFVTRLTKGEGDVTPSLDFFNRTPYELDFGINW